MVNYRTTDKSCLVLDGYRESSENCRHKRELAATCELEAFMKDEWLNAVFRIQ